MALQLSCACGKKFFVDAAQLGKRVQCPACNASLEVTDLDEDDALMEFACPECGNAMKAGASYRGRATSCPKCKSAVTIPDRKSATQTRQSQPRKKPSARLLIGLGAMLLLGGVVLAVILNRRGGTSGNDIDDLSLVPANAQVIVCVKVGTLWQTPAVQKAIGDNPNLGMQLESETGLKPEDIERATVVATDASKSEGWIIVKTKNPYDTQALIRRIRNPRQMTHLDRPYTVGVDERNEPVAFAAINPSVFLFGKEAGVRQALGLIGSPIAKGPLAPVIERCRKDDHVVLGYNPASGSLPEKSLLSNLRALNDMELLFGTLNVRAKVELDLRARTMSEENAEKLRGAANKLLTSYKMLLLSRWLLGDKQREQADQETKLLSGLKIGTEGKDVVATLRVEPDEVVRLLLGEAKQ